MDRTIPAEFQTNFDRWKRMAAALRLLFILLVVLASMSSLAITTFTDELPFWKPLGFNGLKVCTFASALCVGLLTSLDIAGKANRVRRAVRLFTSAVVRYQLDPDFTFDKLVRAHEAGEELVGDVNYIPQHTEEPKPAPPRHPPPGHGPPGRDPTDARSDSRPALSGR